MENQRVDILTKGLVQGTFENIQLLLCALLELLMPQITFWSSPAVELQMGLESCNITHFWMILLHSPFILFCHGAFWFDCFG